MDKKRLFTVIACISLGFMLHAQDVILKTNGDEISAKIQEVGTSEIKYKKVDGSGPVYTIAKSDIFMITYENGSKDVFGRGQKNTANTPVAAQSTLPQLTGTADLPPASKAYTIGDIYNENGVKGIVVKITDGGRHGLVMSLDVSTAKWLKDKDAKFETSAFHEDDGAKNMAAIEQYIGSSSNSWADFPLFEWARGLGNGWYIPAKDELICIADAVNGGTGDSRTYAAKTVKTFSDKIKKAKGKGLLSDGFGQSGGFRQMFSSTEKEGGMIYSLYFNENMGSALLGGTKKGKLEIFTWQKTLFTGGSFTGMVGSRAIHKF